MNNQKVEKTLHALQNDPIIISLLKANPVLWQNNKLVHFNEAITDVGLTQTDVDDASNRLQKFATYLAEVFPETAKSQGIIESPLYRTQNLQDALVAKLDTVNAQLYVKADNQLPVSGSIKARGGIYEVLQHAEQLAIKHKLLTPQDDYCMLNTPKCREFFSQYCVAVGSTGNLGLSIGIMSAKLGFNAHVHMSADAKQWKKDKLRANGVQVFEYKGDYGEAVESGRKQAEQDPYSYFVDDENSRSLFLGYAVAGQRLKQQFDRAGIVINKKRPLYVYLPCGVGGGPGGVALGLKLAFGEMADYVHCVFAEPVQSPCMLLGIYTGLHDDISVHDIGLTNQTDADGLAVARASGFVGKAMQRSLSAFYTVQDQEMYRLLRLAYKTENLKLEPSACSALAGISHFANVDNAVHLAWLTGGSLMPDDIFVQCLRN